jgi:hypothetical protein
VFERGHSITDDLGSPRWRGRTNRCANFVQGAAGGLRNASQVFINGFWSAVRFAAELRLPDFELFT